MKLFVKFNKLAFYIINFQIVVNIDIKEITINKKKMSNNSAIAKQIHYYLSE